MKISKKQSLSLSLLIVLFFFSTMAEAAKVVISLPNLQIPRWNMDGELLQHEIESYGNEVFLDYSNNNDNVQINQLNDYINKGVDILVIVPVNSRGLTEVLKKAKSKDIKVIAYDRLILDTNDVDYYLTFDSFISGKMMGDFLEQRLRLDDPDSKSRNIEFFAGAPEDNNALELWNGAMSVLNKYISSGKLVVKSRETELKQVATTKWSLYDAEKRIKRLIREQNYGPDKKTNTQLDAILAPNDYFATIIIRALINDGFYDKTSLPVITGMDCTKNGVQNVYRGLQSMCVFKDLRLLAKATARLVDAIVKKEPVINKDDVYFYNGVKKVATFLSPTRMVTQDNLAQVLFDSGYYTEKEIKQRH